MDKYKFFWDTMDLCDWSHEGDDDQVLKPVIQALSKQGSQAVFAFHDLMNELLYQLDTRTLAEQCEKASSCSSGDLFLYARCVALMNGPAYYEEARKGRKPEMWNMEFESLLYVPEKAWSLRHGKPVEEYPHVPPLCFETGSNQNGWRK